ncbi:hypothetical protein Trydic_g21809 [Trypoxylus dichotomus]
MDQVTLEELNSLSRSNLLKILITRDAENVEISERLRQYFEDLFSESCNDRKRLSEVPAGLKNPRDPINMGVKTSSSKIRSVSHLETELKQFYDFCRANNVSDEEIASICKPLLPSIKVIKLKFVLYVGILILLLTLFILLSYLEVVHWHYSALGRIFLIELLPVWNWKTLKGETCIIKPPKAAEAPSELQDCTFCEYLHNIDVLDAKETEFIYEKYLKTHRPVILENGMDYWMDAIDYEDIIRSLLTDETLSNSYPCQFRSNINYAIGNLYQSLKDITEYPAYFAHFQNCEFDAVKAFRKYIPRPKFLAAEISPIQYSWMILSNDYAVEKFKAVSLSDRITVVGQLHGKTDIILVPNDCPEDCDVLMIELSEGEVLVFSELWSLEYRPYAGSQNMARPNPLVRLLPYRPCRVGNPVSVVVTNYDTFITTNNKSLKLVPNQTSSQNAYGRSLKVPAWNQPASSPSKLLQSKDFAQVHVIMKEIVFKSLL